MNASNGAKILLIEAGGDDSVAALLRQFPVSGDVMHFTDGNRALDYLFYTGQWSGKYFDPPRLILAGMHLLSCPGPELLRQVKTDERTRLIPCVALVNSPHDPVAKTCREWGVTTLLAQPYTSGAFTHAMINMGMYWVLPELPTGKM